MKKNKILLLFPDGVGIKNYLYSDIFKGISDDLVLMSNFDHQTIDCIIKTVKINDFITIPDYKEGLKEKFLRELICLSRLYFNAKKVDNLSLLTNWNWNQKGIFKKIFYKTIQTTAFFYKKYPTILTLEVKYQKAIRKNVFYTQVKNILQEVKPQSVFCSHQRGLKMATIFAAATDLGISTTTVIYSWDNLPKARLALRADTYLVWSEYMKNEMKLYYPEISQDNIIITGTPQFEFYSNSNNVIDKEVFYKKYNLDLNKKIICFSGDDEKTSPDDPKYLEDIVQTIFKDNLQEKYQILFRRCPVDLSGRFDQIVKKHQSLIKEAPPIWHFNDTKKWTTIYPDFEDIKLLASTAYYSDVVINVGSTMAFDFAMYNKPCIFINYDQEDKQEQKWSTKTIYNFQHFRSMSDSNAVYWLKNNKEIMNVVQQALTENNTVYMDNWKQIVLGDYKNASKKIKENLQIS
ncbi:CDP-glycerol glycerophosphotransferase family protein [Flavobacterium sp.]|uniref:CDP-glycerol glycerophosphotransferase family protein n=1 Tax=Flavobacterium sp. TaxID=239 RepID=UPI00286E51BB|nr:CDP-glycerol glycerophosphotransferase family protein [Flavobacterium sp.]